MKKEQDDIVDLRILSASEAHLHPNSNKHEDLDTIEITFSTGIMDDGNPNGINIYIKPFLCGDDETILSTNIKRSSAVYLHQFLTAYLQLND